MRTALAAALAAALTSGTASAQVAPGTLPVAAAWSFSASAYTYVLPDAANYVQPTIAADRGQLHLEGRFNYEDLETGSAWFGFNFSVGERVTLEITPMLGAMFGKTTGIAPGYKGSLAWRMLALSSETEYVFDLGESAGSFLYTWSELEIAPADWCRFGLVLQRTKAYETDFDVQRGFFVGFSLRRIDATAYVLNPDADRPTVVVGIGVGF